MIDVRAIRDKLGMSQAEFARATRIPAANIKNWEQGRARPDTGGAILLALIDRAPDVVLPLLRDLPQAA